MLLATIVLTTVLKPAAMASDVNPLSPSVVIIHTMDDETSYHIPYCTVKVYDESYKLVYTLNSGAAGVCDDITPADYSRFYVTARGIYNGVTYFGYETESSGTGIQEWYIRMYPQAVGGVVVPVDKFGLLAPYTGLYSAILVATVATALYVKRVKRRKEKQ